ncbi:MAG: site-2 protease family protein [Firmicutes bacterium]|nr:site-2 protease family protein [Bacillota bacterium]MDD4791884.1 site-2 protease family protein [Bacillota bacterium]
MRRAWVGEGPGLAGIVRVFGIELHVDPLVVVFAVLYALAGSFWQWAFVFASLVVHEGSHAMAAAGFGHAVARISITPIGAVASLEGEIHSRPEAEAAVAMAGPMTSLILAALGYLLLLYGNADRDKVEFFVGANIALAIFNLIPAFPLDGGRVLRALMAEELGVASATHKAIALSRVIGIAITILGVAGFAARYFNLLVPALGLFIWIAAGRESESAAYAGLKSVMGKRASLRERGALPARLLAAAPDMVARDLLRKVTSSDFTIVSVIGAEGREIGRLSELELLEGISLLGPNAAVCEVLAGRKD